MKLQAPAITAFFPAALAVGSSSLALLPLPAVRPGQAKTSRADERAAHGHGGGT
jgi:hypothetical protein